ncbi:dephospho-CoA kinase [Neobacillus terrae]|uniref:dephospho-CoA kinase n=1 Tax=Neobacillus terrae TaxID=3034837 RepID=UPI00140939EA|nr:dephospho-CoA kinase [Neobacillus terrae]NHM30562.1 dephospho-CoA kinase [Neobacillus terrae]
MALIIGLTGGIASGKSTVSNMFKEKGITVVDADVEARLAVETGEPAYFKIVENFGSDILLPDGSIDRPKLGSIIFHNEEKRRVLNEIVHPDVRRRMNEKKEIAVNRGEKAVVLDIPLLFESRLEYMADKTILVYVDAPVQLSRLMSRNGLSREDAEARIMSQMDLKIKINLANAVIDNNGTIEETKKQLDSILESWIK